jgi:hypothetical protein
MAEASADVNLPVGEGKKREPKPKKEPRPPKEKKPQQAKKKVSRPRKRAITMELGSSRNEIQDLLVVQIIGASCTDAFNSRYILPY